MAEEITGGAPVAEAGLTAVAVEAPPAAVVVEAARPWGPTQPEERISLIDVLRGLALFGIIAANMRGFAGPLYTYFRPNLLWNTRLDWWMQAFNDTFIQGKFITIFAFLFGVGFVLQFSRAEQRGAKFVRVYLRRLLALILIGAAHQLLFWWGDVLITYALGGFVLILFRKRKSKTILIWALALMVLPLAGAAGYTAFRYLRPQSPQKMETNKKKAEAERHKMEAEMWGSIEVYRRGNYLAIFKYRLGELKRQNMSQGFAVAMTLPIFLLGFWVFRQGILQNPEAHRVALKRGLIIGAIAGIPANIALTWIMQVTTAQVQVGPPTPLMLAGGVLFMLGRPVLSMSYACGIGLLFLNPTWRERIMRFAVIGRTALSNYLFQTVFCTTIFYGYGLGLFGRVHLFWLFLLSIAVYALEVPLSRWWLARYRFGPAEWVWRSMTYGKAQMIRLQVQSSRLQAETAGLRSD